MAIPPEDLQTWLDMVRAVPGQYAKPGGLALLEAALYGWADHRHFVASDDDKFAERFFHDFESLAQFRFGLAEDPGWAAPLAAAFPNPEAALAAFFDLLKEIPPPPSVSVPDYIPVPIPEGKMLHNWLKILKNLPETRPGDGSLEALRPAIEAWQPDPQDDFARLMQQHLGTWLAYRCRKSLNDTPAPEGCLGWDKLVFEALPHPNVWATFMNMVEDLAAQERRLHHPYRGLQELMP